MNEKIKKQVKKIFTVVSVGFHPEGYILDKLFEKDVVTAQQVQEIEAIPENGGRAKKLLYLLYSEISHPEAFVVLREALQEEYGWLVQKIDEQECLPVATNKKASARSVGAQIQNKPVVEVNKVETKTYVEEYHKVKKLLARYMDPDNGLLMCLITNNIMGNQDYGRVDRNKPYEEINEDLIVNFIDPKIETHCKEFLNALVESDQDHIAKFIMTCGNNLDSEDRVLNDKELDLINNNMFCLVNLIKPYRMDFLYRLVSKRCISDRQKGRIECRKEFPKKIDELLTVMKRKRWRDFRNFKMCLHDTMQNRVVQILERGGVVTVRIKLNAREDKKIIESKLIKLVTGYIDEEHEIDKTLTREQVAVIKDLLKEFEKLDIYLIGNAAWHSIAMFFMCESSKSFKAFVEFFESGKLKEMLERMYHCLLGLSDDEISLIKVVSIIDQFKRVEYMDEFPVILAIDGCQISCYVEIYPVELVDLILWRTVVATWIAISKDAHEPGFLEYCNEMDRRCTGYKRFLNFLKVFSVLVYKNLSSVCSAWQQIFQRKSFLKVVQNKIFTNLIRKSFPMLVERMEVNVEFTVQLWRSKIISMAEYDDLQSVMDNETDARVRTEQVNVAVLRSLLRNGCRDFLKFLQLLEGDERASVCGQNWPLDSMRRERLMKHQAKFMEVELSGLWKQTGTDVQEADRRFDSDEAKRSSDENDITRSDTKGLGEIHLLDVLYNRGCIPLKKKKAMERGTKDLRNREFFHVLVNGSIKTFEIISNFLKVTHQIRMLDILVGNYIAEDLHRGVKILLYQGDITTFEVDVIVSAASSKLTNAGGISAAIISAGGVEILEECQRHIKTVGSELPFGDIFVSSAGKLFCKNVIHAIGPRWKYGDAEEKRQLTDCVRKSMIEASNREFQSIAFPAISSGYKVYPVEMSTFIILDAIYSYLDDEKPSSLKEIYLVDIDESAMQSFERKLHMLQASRNAELNVGHHNVQHVETVTVKNENHISGVAWLENKIYVTCESSKVHVFQDQEPFEELEGFEIPGMRNPYDLIASKTSRSLFISNNTFESGLESGCLRKVQMPDRDVRQWVMEGWVGGMSISSSDELLVVASREGLSHLDIYRSLDVVRTKSFSLPIEIIFPSNAVQSSKGNFFISYGNIHSTFGTICEFDGKKIIRSFDYSSLPERHLNRLYHLSIDEDDRVFAADYRAGKVMLFNSKLTHFKFLLDERHMILLPYRICYLRDTQQLIVGHTRTSASVSIFDLHG